MKKNFKESTVYLTLVLCVFCAVCALALSVVNRITAPKIAEIAIQKTKDAMAVVSPDADDFILVENDGSVPTIKEIYKTTKDGVDSGYCILVTPNGYGGPLSIMVGVSLDQTVLGVDIISLKETPGLGTKADNPDWLAQFKDAVASVKVVKQAPAQSGEIAALSGATVTSLAVTSGVQDALDYVGRQK